MAARKTQSPARDDVPTSIVLGAVGFLLIVFVPLVVRTGDLPTTLPPFSASSQDVDALHTPRVLPSVPPFLAQSYAAVDTAMAQHDPRALAVAQRDFATMLLDATVDAPALREQVREQHLRHFLAALEGGPGDPLADVARRHGLSGDRVAPGVDRATRIAWFDLRWEALAARETVRGESPPLERLVERLAAAERRTIVAWILGAECDVIVGAVSALGASEITQCASARRAFVELATVIDPRYPHDEALASIDAMQGAALDRLAGREADVDRAGTVRTAARAAFGDAHARFTALCAHDDSRRLGRYLRGTLDASGM